MAKATSGKTRARDFYPPLPRGWCIGLARRLAPWMVRRFWKVEKVEIDAADLERLRALNGQRVILTPNHPSIVEPMIVFLAAARAGLSPYFLASWESFFYFGKWFSVVLQRLGCYSVMRGRRDRASMQMTQRLLLEGKRIVIFPEGETYGLNDTLLPFQQGVVQMGFWALEEMQRRNVNAPLLVVPMAVKYVYTQAMGSQLEASLQGLETKLGLPPNGLPPYERLRQVATAVVGTLEREHDVKPAEGASLDERIAMLRDVIIDRIATALKASLPRSGTFPERVRALFNAYHDVIYGESDEEESEYQRALREQAAEALKPLRADWERLHNFLAVRDEYVKELPSVERFLDVLGRLEIEVLGKSQISGMRRAFVKVGEPIDLRAHLETYRRNKRETVAQLTHDLEGRVMGLLTALMQRTKPARGLAG